MQRQLSRAIKLCKAKSVNIYVKKIEAQGLMLLVVTLMVLPLFLNACSNGHSNSGPSLTVVGIEISPNCFESEGEIVGIDADTAKLAMENAGISAEFSINDSFADAYQATLDGPRRALLSVTYTEDRKDLFKWAGPTSKGNYDIFVKASSGISAGIGVEACKNLESIAVVDQGWKETTVLEGLGFQNLSYYNTYEAAINAFKNDEVTAMASDRAQFVEGVSLAYFREQDIGVACIYHSSYYFIAFSTDVDDRVVQRCQDAIDALTTDGTTFDIYRDYVPYATKDMVPSLIQLHTEIDPPYNYMTSYSEADWAFAGSSVEIVNEIQAQNSYKNNISVTSWVAGYQALQYMPNYALFTMARTTERENLFQWVGPIVSFTDHFYTLTASNLQISTLDQAKALDSVATPSDWYTHDYLTTNGFENILVTANTAEEAFDQLIDGTADALLMNDTSVNWFCKQKGIPPADLTKQLSGNFYEGYIAFSQNTPAGVVAQWQNDLDAMKADGRFRTIWDKWYDGVEMP
jgi:polar amino acid transport system substrate-binding protein